MAGRAGVAHLRAVTTAEGGIVPLEGMGQTVIVRRQPHLVSPVPEGLGQKGLSLLAYALSHNSASTAPGDMGSRVMRTPTALEMALAIAAIGGTRDTSPTPRTPKG